MFGDVQITVNVFDCWKAIAVLEFGLIQRKIKRYFDG
ncbi:hypothetical protein EVA_14133 [gut metagenome]|uniref:Uncharacterized protein n=1 Tax=gut metagenome TaxID=749906 RepID=J9CCS0_9ZZZZ